MNFNYFLPVNILFGQGRVQEAGEQTARYGTKALIVTGGSSVKRTGLLERLLQSLEAAGVKHVLYDQVTPNPTTDTVYEGSRIATEEGCDVILGVGGGSSLDAAKAIAFHAVNQGDLSEYIFGKQFSEKALPIILIPTTCGTGSEGNGFAVLTNPQTKDKKSLRCNAIIAKCSIVDPQVMMTMPKELLACVGFDALCHSMEAYLSKYSQPFVQIYALEAIRLIGETLVSLYHNSQNNQGWEKLTLASLLGGMVINMAGVTAAHGLEHPVSGLKDIVHGKGLAALTPFILEETIASAPEKCAAIAGCLGGKAASELPGLIRKLLFDLNLATTLGEMGVEPEDVDWMAENCLKISKASLDNHPRQFGLEELKRLYTKAL